MEPQQQQNQQNPNEDHNNGSNKLICRQSSTRWTPTADQVRILKELYYKNGVRSPSAEQIQRISARLRQYGKIEGKNVFYWFQNHKARERQKKRFNAATTTAEHHHPNRHVASIHRAVPCNKNAVGKTEHELSFHNRSCGHMDPGYSAASSVSAGVITVNGKMGNHRPYGSVTMEKHFKDCSISPALCSNNGATGSINQRLKGCANIDHHHRSKHYNLFDHQIKSALKEEEDENTEMNRTLLPLFPMHPSAPVRNHGYRSGWYLSDHPQHDGNASLELTLNSYTGVSPD